MFDIDKTFTHNHTSDRILNSVSDSRLAYFHGNSKVKGLVYLKRGRKLDVVPEGRRRRNVEPGKKPFPITHIHAPLYVQRSISIVT